MSDSMTMMKSSEFKTTMFKLENIIEKPKKL